MVEIRNAKIIPNIDDNDEGNMNAVNIPTRIRYVAVVPILRSFAYIPAPIKPNKKPHVRFPNMSRYGPIANRIIPPVVKFVKFNSIATITVVMSSYI